MRFQGQKLGFVAGSLSDGKSLILRLPHGDLSKAPRLGDLALIRDETTNHSWLARVEKQSHVSIELHEQEVRNAIARGQTSLGAELSDHEKEMYLGHDYELKLLGEIRTNLNFAPVARVLPPRGATVNHLKADELKQLVMLDSDGATIGYYAVGDEVHDTDSNQIPVKFSVKRFVSRRSAIFGVAGFGKSNLMKNILAELTVSEPTVGKLVFDLEGEYSFGGGDEAKKRFGLADIPSVAERLVVHTNAKRSEPQYQSVMAGAPVLNLGEISARKVVSTLLPESRQERVYADLLRGLTSEKWKKVLDLVATGGYDTNTAEVAHILGISHDDNLVSIQGMVRALVPMTKGHSASSNMMRDVLENLKMGATVVIDLSGMGLDAAFNLTSFMVDELFETNQTAFVAGGNVPEVVVFVEEAQNLLSDRQVREGNPIARLAKEGRKYNLGLVYVSQQPGAIAKEILTQTNTFFVFHLLSKIDIKALQDINPHYEGVIADFIQMESLQGHAYIYSTVPEMPVQSYVFATKSTSFQETIESLKKRPTSGASDIRKYRAEVVLTLAAILKDVLKTQPKETTQQGEDRYRSGPISGELAKRLPSDLFFVRARDPRWTETYWLLEGCQKLGYEARMEWAADGKPYLYLKEEGPPPPVIRPETVDSSDEIPF
jgi:DNA helicase HerA-like ATPase